MGFGSAPRRNHRRWLWRLRIGLLVTLLVAIFALYVDGSTLKVLEGARIVLLILLIATGGLGGRRHQHRSRQRNPD